MNKFLRNSKYAQKQSNTSTSFGGMLWDSDHEHAVKYFIKEAKENAWIDPKAFSRTPVYNGTKVKMNPFLTGPKDDAEAYLYVARAAAIEAIGVPQNQRQRLIEIAEKHLNQGESWSQKSGDNRIEIAQNGIRQIQSALQNTKNKRGGRGLSILIAATGQDILNWTDNQPTEFDFFKEAVSDTVTDTVDVVHRVAEVADLTATAIVGEGCRVGESKQDCEKRMARERYIKYGLMGMLGVSVIGALGIWYIGQIKSLFPSKSESKSIKQDIGEQQ